MTQTTLDQIMICGGFDEYILATSPAKLMSGPCSHHYYHRWSILRVQPLVNEVLEGIQNHKLL